MNSALCVAWGVTSSASSERASHEVWALFNGYCVRFHVSYRERLRELASAGNLETWGKLLVYLANQQCLRLRHVLGCISWVSLEITELGFKFTTLQ